MSQLTRERGVAKCDSCGRIHTVEIEGDDSIRVLGIGTVNRCSCGADGLCVLRADLETPPVPEPRS